MCDGGEGGEGRVCVCVCVHARARACVRANLDLFSGKPKLTFSFLCLSSKGIRGKMETCSSSFSSRFGPNGILRGNQEAAPLFEHKMKRHSTSL